MRIWTRMTVGVVFFLGLLLIYTLPVRATELVLASTPSVTGAERVFIARNGPELLVDVDTGLSAEVPIISDIETAAGGLLRWELVSDTVDDLEHRHVTYQQVYQARGTGAPNAPVRGDRPVTR